MNEETRTYMLWIFVIGFLFLFIYLLGWIYCTAPEQTG